MADFILIDGDKAIFMTSFGLATVTVKPGTLKGSGPGTINGKKMCVVGDEANVSVPGCAYVTPVYSILGTGTLKIKSLTANQKAKKTKTGQKKVLLKGNTFEATFEVQNPAKQPNPTGPIPDATPQYSGQGSFKTTNTLFKGT